MHTTAQFDDDERGQPGYAGLAGLIAGLLLGGAVLYRLAGLPHLPAALPSWEVVLLTLQGSSVPYAALTYLFTTAAWVVWFWLVGSLALRLVVVSAETVTHGAVWIRPLRLASDLVTLPIIRRLVDGAIVVLFVVNLAGRPAATAAAAPLTPTTTVAAAPLQRAASPAPAPSGIRHNEERQAVTYTVQSGDTLWGIAERFYGSGTEYPRLVQANTGRLMADGGRFTQAGVIQPGWALLVPLPSQAVVEVDGVPCYVVEAGDTMQGIAARLLGDEGRWRDIFDLNQGRAHLAGGRVLRDPGLIWPGLQLKLPLPVADRNQQPPAAPPDPAPPQPSAAPAVANQPAPLPTPASHAAPAVQPEAGAAGSPAFPLGDGAAGLAAGAAAAGATALLRRRVRRSLNEPPVPPPPRPTPSEDFAEAEFARQFTNRLHDGGRELVGQVAHHALRFLAEHGLEATPVVMALQGRTKTTLTLDAGLEAQAKLLELGGAFAQLLGGKGLASLTPDRDVALQVHGPTLAGLHTPVRDARDLPLCLLPLGILPSQEMLYVNWDELGHVLVAGLPGGGTEVVLTSLIAALTAHRRPEDLVIWTIASGRSLPAQLQRLPHQACGLVNADDSSQVGEALHRVRGALLRRMEAAKHAGEEERTSLARPEILLVIGDLESLPDDDGMLEWLGVYGPAYGVRLLAATTNGGAIGEEVASYFGTRLVLQTLDDQESIQLLGQPDGADLGSGDVLVRVEGRLPVRVQGLRVSPDHLNELVQLMREAYGGPLLVGSVPPDSRFSLEREAERPCNEPQAAPSHKAVAVENGHQDAGAILLAVTGLESAQRPAIVDDVHLDGDEPMAPPMPDGTQQPPDHRETPSTDPGDDSALTHGAPRQLLLDSVESVVSRERPAEDAPVPQAQQGGQGSGLDLDAASPEEAVPAVAADAFPAAGSRIQVRCFGEFEVRTGDREIRASLEERSVNRSFELLAFLAAQRGGSVSKDKVLAALWPDADEDRGMGSLHVTANRLRGVLTRYAPWLSSSVVRCDRDGMCRLDTEVIWSDVHEFLELTRAASKLPPDQEKAALQRAVALYRGNLLAGTATRLYQWADERGEAGVSLRDQYREEHNRAVQRLARLLYRDGQATQAVPLLRRLLRAEPTLEDVVRDLYCCYQQLRDLGSLVREDRHLRQALQETYFDPDDPDDAPKRYQPEAETVELFTKIREELEA